MTFCFRKLPLYVVAVGVLALAATDVFSLSSDGRDTIEAKLQRSEGKRGTAGCVIVDLETGKTLLSHNADEKLIPASNMKLVTTIAALHQLGGDFEFITRILKDGEIRNGKLTGDLCVIGGGDPNISGRFHDGDPLALFKSWADSLKRQGITEVTGDLCYDSTLFGGEDYAPGWPADDQYIKWYCARVSALAFNDNCVGIRVVPTSAGKPARIEVVPETAYVTVINKTTTAPGRKGAEIGIIRPRGENTITVKGRVYEKATWGYFTDVTVSDPAAYAATVFKETLEARGVTVKGEVKAAMLTGKQLKQENVLVEHRAPLLQTLGPINTNSQNLHAEMLFRQLGLRYAGKGTFKTGRAAVEEFLKSEELFRPGIEISDGSGLARDNRVSAGLLVKLLQKMEENEHFESFKSSLAVGGESGTLERRLRERHVKGKVFAKTGYINGVRALSGYLFTDDRRIAFSILMNSCVYTKPTQDEILSTLAKAVK